MRERRIRKHQKHPVREYQYFVGGDPSGGTGNDDAAIIVLCADTVEQVYAFNDNTTNPVEYAYLLASVGKTYNEAYIVCEGNNHGLSVHPILKREYPGVKIYKRSIITGPNQEFKYGFMTSENSKKMLTGAIQDVFDFGLRIYDRETADALLEFEEDEEGKMEGPGDHLVIALGLACFGLMRKGGKNLAKVQALPDLKTYRERVLERMNQNHMKFNADEVLEELKQQHRRQLGRFRRQVV